MYSEVKVFSGGWPFWSCAVWTRKSTSEICLFGIIENEKSKFSDWIATVSVVVQAINLICLESEVFFPRTVRVWRDKGSLFLRGTFSWSSFSVPVVVLFLKSLGWNTAPVLGLPQWAACPTFCLGADPLAASKTLQLIFHLVSLANARWCLLAAKRVNTLFFGPTLRNNCILLEEISLAI